MEPISILKDVLYQDGAETLILETFLLPVEKDGQAPTFTAQHEIALEVKTEDFEQSVKFMVIDVLSRPAGSDEEGELAVFETEDEGREVTTALHQKFIAKAPECLKKRLMLRGLKALLMHELVKGLIVAANAAFPVDFDIETATKGEDHEDDQP